MSIPLKKARRRRDEMYPLAELYLEGSWTQKEFCDEMEISRHVINYWLTKDKVKLILQDPRLLDEASCNGFVAYINHLKQEHLNSPGPSHQMGRKSNDIGGGEVRFCEEKKKVCLFTWIFRTILPPNPNRKRTNMSGRSISSFLAAI